jgi:programmed cell death protein 5
MSGNEELGSLRKQRLLELQQKLLQEQTHADAEKRLEVQKQTLIRRMLTSEARQRLANLKMVKPEFASHLELQLIQISQQGKIELPINDDQLKGILRSLQKGRKEIRIRRV